MDYKKKLEKSTTVHVRHLHWLSTEADVRKLFSQAGKIKNIIMGMEKETLTSSDFCFVEYVQYVFLTNYFKFSK